MRDDFMGPDAQDIAEIEREARAAEKRWAAEQTPTAEPCGHPYPVAGRCVACAERWNPAWLDVSGCRCGLQLGHGGDCQDGGAL